jgi:hypothetical protein
VIHVRLVVLGPIGPAGLMLGKAHRVIIAARGGTPRARTIFDAGDVTIWLADQRVTE